MIKQNNLFTRNNNFNLLRVYLSLSVVFFHSYELSMKQELSSVNWFFNGERAVEAFFIISGYLIMKSYYRSESAKDFFIKRIKRIYPAYLTIILLCALLGSTISTYSFSEYFTSFTLYKYIASNLAFLNFIQPSLPGVFTGNRFETVNGSLWTLKIEVAYYILVPLLVFMRKRINVHLLYALLFLSSVGYYIGMKHLHQVHNNDNYLFLSRQIPGQLFYFILGAWASELETKPWFATAVRWLGVPFFIALFFPTPLIVQSILLAVSVFFFAYMVPTIRYPYKDEDISYGLYIYHFPVIQVLVYYQLFNYSALEGLIGSVLITIFLAALSWVFIEKPFIVKKTNRKNGVKWIGSVLNNK